MSRPRVLIRRLIVRCFHRVLGCQIFILLLFSVGAVWMMCMGLEHARCIESGDAESRQHLVALHMGTPVCALQSTLYIRIDNSIVSY
ncbi:hypothetical protein BJY04DRAFT_197188 [Aspergillus karnatakaensis]|uniref:uncharacterized protein n=1 Tax=Aspergillus karnatakaensis TaxID=1810916 RepID=UPI003CCD7339